MQIKLILIFFLSLIISLLVTWFTRRWAIRFRLGALPDARKVHEGFMPHMGGFGIFAGFLAGLLGAALFFPSLFRQILFGQFGLLSGAVLVVALGAYDDMKGMNAAQKFGGEFVISTILILSGFVIKKISLPFGYSLDLSWSAVPITYLWLIGLMNAVNLLDGLDGLAGGVCAIAALVILSNAWLTGNGALFIITLAFLAGILGFLKFNVYPASIFMGDTGSLFLGFVLAVLSVIGFQNEQGQTRLLVAMVVLAIPIGDTSVAFFRRLNKGKHPFKPDKDHLHHRLIYLGLSHRQAVHIIYLTSLLYALAAYLIITRSEFFGGLVLLMLLLISYLGLRRVGYLEAQHIKKYYGDHSIIEVKKEIAPLNMRRIWHKILLIISDMFMVNLSLFAAWWGRYQSGWISGQGQIGFKEFMITPAALLLTFFWLTLFVLNNLYYLRWDVSRFDQVRRTGRVILFGLLLLFLITVDPAHILSEGRLTILIYGLSLLIFVNSGRLLIIFIEKKFSVLEYGRHKTLIIGASNKAKKLLKDIRRNPHLLYEPVGYITRETQNKRFAELPFLGTYERIPEVIRKHNVEEVIIAINERSRDEILNIVALAESSSVIFKIPPQIYDVVSGHKTAEVIGHQLIRLFPDSMRLWQWGLKRLLDITVSALLIFLFSPLALFIVLFQMLSGVHTPFIIENMIGKNGQRFGMLNFAVKTNSQRPLPLIGRFLYFSRLYKMPELINIFLGQMSLVGPRPDSEENVRYFRQKIKFYNRRFQIRPGLTGWAQVKYRYEEALKYKRDQLKQDLFYLENMSLSFDLRILLRSFFIFLLKKETP